MNTSFPQPPENDPNSQGQSSDGSFTPFGTPIPRKVVRWSWDRGAFAFERAWTSELAHAVGVILGDGSITKDWITIELDQKDTDILQFVARAVSMPEAAIHMTHRKAKGGESRTATLKLCSRAAVKDLLTRTGLQRPGAKHHVIKIPPSLPDEFLPDFLRGLIDTDGTVVLPNRRSPQIVLYSNSLTMLQELQARCSPILNSPRLGAIHVGACRGTHMWVITGHEAKPLAEWLWPVSGWVGGQRKAGEANEKVLAWIPRRAPRAKT